ncbi:MAG: transcriptional regulator, partial [Caldisericum exile]
NGLPKPDFINYEQGIGAFSVIFYKDIYTEENLRKIGFNERQIRAVIYVKQKGKFTNKEYQVLNAVFNKTAYIDLTDLAEKKLIRCGRQW